jgi:hypothetical protein
MGGPSPNPALDGESRVGEIIAIISTACVLSTLIVALRCYSRAVILRSFGLDDAMMIPAQVRNTGAFVCLEIGGFSQRLQILTIASAVAIGLGT